MRKIFFFILLCILFLILYWFRGYFSSYFSENTENSQLSYTLLYQEALKRSKESVKTHRVIVSQEDMENEDKRGNLANQDKKPRFTESAFNTKQMQSQSDSSNRNGSNTNLKIPNGDFGSLGARGTLAKLNTPSFGNDGSGGGSGDGSCRGIIFTPCIEAKLLETYEGPWKLRKSGAPIYNKIEAIPKNIF